MPQPYMLAGHLQGRVLAMLAQLIKPRNVLEIGTYTGYSALCLAEGLHPNGHLHTIDQCARFTAVAQRYIQKAGKQSQMTCHTGKAWDIIPTIPGTFDLVFIDADKSQYSHYYDMTIERLVPNGWLIADNMLRGGEVLPSRLDNPSSPATQAIRAFTTQVRVDTRVTQLLLPIRDGLLIARKQA